MKREVASRDPPQTNIAIIFDREIKYFWFGPFGPRTAPSQSNNFHMTLGKIFLYITFAAKNGVTIKLEEHKCNFI